MRRSALSGDELSGNTAAIVLAGGKGERLGALTRDVCKPALPFGAAFRNIDFTLTNCVNSGIRRIGIATQHTIYGLVRRSVVFPSVRLGRGSVVERSVVLPGAVIGRNCRLSDAIVASDCHVPDETVIDAGWRDRAQAAGNEPVVLTNTDFESVPLHACV